MGTKPNKPRKLAGPGNASKPNADITADVLPAQPNNMQPPTEPRRPSKHFPILSIALCVGGLILFLIGTAFTISAARGILNDYSDITTNELQYATDISKPMQAKKAELAKKAAQLMPPSDPSSKITALQSNISGEEKDIAWSSGLMLIGIIMIIVSLFTGLFSSGASARSGALEQLNDILTKQQLATAIVPSPAAGQSVASVTDTEKSALMEAEPQPSLNFSSIQAEMEGLERSLHRFLGALSGEVSQLDTAIRNNNEKLKKLQKQNANLVLWLTKLDLGISISPDDPMERISEKLRKHLSDLHQLSDDINIVIKNIDLPVEKMQKLPSDSLLFSLQTKMVDDKRTISSIPAVVKHVQDGFNEQIQDLKNELLVHEGEINEYARQFDLLSNGIGSKKYQKMSAQIATEDTQRILANYKELAKLQGSLSVPTLKEAIVYFQAIESTMDDVKRLKEELLPLAGADAYLPNKLQMALEFDLFKSFHDDQSIANTLGLSATSITPENAILVQDALRKRLIDEWTKVSAAFIAREYIARFAVHKTRERQETFVTKMLKLSRGLDTLTANLRSLSEGLGIMVHPLELFHEPADKNTVKLSGTVAEWEHSPYYADFLREMILDNLLQYNGLMEISYWGYDIKGSPDIGNEPSTAIAYDASKKERLTRPR